MLSRLISELQNQTTENLFTYSVVIVDNDVNKSAQVTVSDWKQKSAIHIEYFCEPDQNIALARNKALANSKGNLIAFIDDDEFPERTWLFNLFKALKNYGADGILGPVIPHFEIKPPSWVIKSRLFDRPTLPSGHVLKWTETRTGNVLLKKEIISKVDKWFDPAFGSGGEDRDFFKRLIDNGHRFIWSNESYVFETVPPHRWNRIILLKRALLRGKMSFKRAKSKPLSVLYSLMAVTIYLPCLPLFVVLGQNYFMIYLIKIFDHIGKLAAFLRINLVKEKYVG